MTKDIFVEGLEAQEEVHAALTRKYSWFTHDTSLSRLQEIRDAGLPVNAYESFEIPDDVKHARGGEKNCEMLCLHPVGADLRPQSSREKPHMRLAVPADKLPGKLNMDWSYCPNSARKRRMENAKESVGQISAAMAQKLGSVSTYEGISASALRVKTKGSSDDPATWPPVLDANDADIWSF